MNDNSEQLLTLPPLAGNWRQRLFVLSGVLSTDPQPLMEADSERWCFLVWCTVNGALLQPRGVNLTNWQGMPISTAPPILQLCYRDLGPVVGGAWDVIVTGGGGIISVLSMSWTPRG